MKITVLMVLLCATAMAQDTYIRMVYAIQEDGGRKVVMTDTLHLGDCWTNDSTVAATTGYVDKRIASITGFDGTPASVQQLADSLAARMIAITDSLNARYSAMLAELANVYARIDSLNNLVRPGAMTAALSAPTDTAKNANANAATALGKFASYATTAALTAVDDTAKNANRQAFTATTKAERADTSGAAWWTQSGSVATITLAVTRIKDSLDANARTYPRLTQAQGLIKDSLDANARTYPRLTQVQTLIRDTVTIRVPYTQWAGTGSIGNKDSVQVTVTGILPTDKIQVAELSAKETTGTYLTYNVVTANKLTIYGLTSKPYTFRAWR